jgi:hypothetical protein
MAINFPNNNVKNGDVYSPPGSPEVVYVYNATRGMWIGAGGNSPVVGEFSSQAGQPSFDIDNPTLMGYTGSRGFLGSRGYTGSQSMVPGYVGSRGYTGSRGLPGASGKTTIPVRKDGVDIVAAAEALNFTGSGVIVAPATNVTVTAVNITISGGGSGGGGSGGGGSGSVRTSASISTGAIIATGSVTRELTTAKGYALYSLTTSVGAWVTLYSSNAARLADANRIKTTDPLPNSGVIADIITTGASPSTVLFTPALFGFNSESPAVGATYLKIVNNSGQALSVPGITVTISHLGLES